jgi:tetratricopeptide (TPR) repeat protein
VSIVILSGSSSDRQRRAFTNPQPGELPMTYEADALSEFKRLFWQARRARKPMDTKPAKDALGNAAAFARENGLDAEARVAEAGILELDGQYAEAAALLNELLADPSLKLIGLAWFLSGALAGGQKDYARAIECCQKAIDTPGYDAPGYAWNNMGLAYARQKDYARAIECCQKAIDTPGYDAPGNAWNNMGLAYAGQKEYARAIECHQKAIDTPGYDTPGNAWNNMGVAYTRQKEYARAIEYFQKAIDTPGYDTPGYAWNNLGLAYAGQKDYARAIECYQKAIDTPGFDTPGKVWYNMGNAFANQGNDARAIECWNKAVPWFEKSGEHDWAAFARSKADAATLKPSERSTKDEALLKSPSTSPEADERRETPEARMMRKTAKVEADKYQQYVTKARSGQSDVLAILRGWGSAVSLIEPAGSPCRGGGYLLKWRDKGLVVDPGFDFLRNFQAAGFHCGEIHAVAVSHNHPDHNHDLRSLDDVRYELYKRSDSGTAEQKAWAYTLIWDQDTADHRKFDPEEAAYRQAIRFDVDRVRLGLEKSIDLQKLAGLPFDIKYFRARHTADTRHAVGLRVECYHADPEKRPVVIGFTCDTEYFPQLCTPEFLGACDILIAHISQPDPREYSETDFRKNGHLGYRGVESLVREAKPRLTIVSEFWAGLADLRIDLVQGLRDACGTKAILPGSIGLLVHPETGRVRCSNCGKWTPCDQIGVGSPEAPLGPLAYLCADCRIGS